MSALDLALSIGIFAAIALIAAAYRVRLARRGNAVDPRVERAGGSRLLGLHAMQMGAWALRPIARVVGAAGIRPNAVSSASLVLGAGAGVAVGLSHFGAGAALSLASSACDALDGMVARATGKANDAGEVFDATVDRYAELFLLGGMALQLRDNAATLLVALAAIAGAFMVSYSTAASEAMRVEVSRGSMRRQERAVYLAVGAALVPFAQTAAARAGGPPWVVRLPIVAALALVAVIGNISAGRRLAAVARALPGSSHRKLGRTRSGSREIEGVAS